MTLAELNDRLESLHQAARLSENAMPTVVTGALEYACSHVSRALEVATCQHEWSAGTYRGDRSGRSLRRTCLKCGDVRHEPTDY